MCVRPAGVCVSSVSPPVGERDAGCGHVVHGGALHGGARAGGALHPPHLQLRAGGSGAAPARARGDPL
eukprot:9490318-Pyramimonas_sp.AAC.1